VPLQRRQLAFVHVRHGRRRGGGLLNFVAPWCSPSSKLKRGARWSKPTPQIKNAPSRGTLSLYTCHFCCFLDWEIGVLTRRRLCRFGGHGSGEIVDEREMRCAGVPISGGAGARARQEWKEGRN
jgi:hypothetical protein